MGSFWNSLFFQNEDYRWSTAPSMKRIRYGCAAATLGDDTILVVGGHDGKTETDSVELLASNDEWVETATRMQSKRLSCAAVTLKGGYGRQSEYIVVVGGHDGRHSLESAEKYNPRLEMWTSIEPMKTSKRFDFAAATIQNRIYVAGGHNGTNCTDSVEMYDADYGRWNYVIPMRRKRFQCNAVSLNRKVYVIGGLDDTGKVLDVGECYDEATGVWTDLPRMSTPRKACAVAVVENQIFVFGGHCGKKALNTVEMYDPETSKWSSLPPMRNGRVGGAAASLGNKIYVVGGTDGKGGLDSVEQLIVNHQTGEPCTHNLNDYQNSSSHGTTMSSVVSSPPPTLEDPPNEFLCPITGDVMRDPVVTSDGYTYEREAIEEWIRRFSVKEQPRSPATNVPMSRELYPNNVLKSLCHGFLQNHKQLQNR